MNFKISVKSMVIQSMVAAIYAVITWAIPSLSYGPIQFRISEVMTLLAFFNPQYIIGLTVGCALSNIFSSLGMIDIIVGTFASFLAAFVMSKIKNIWIASLMPALSAIIIGAEIVFVSPEPISYYVITTQIAISEFIIVTLVGVPLFKILSKNKKFKENILELKQ
ncbi:QueT transporter family protein [Peptostreptococcus canis]|uniref:QueT transporter family protein n=1 Tax=Peptostreptococcus canis TaxID=1159213 RepID=A0ABR6TN77_9FIRM|nr:QueT transporter family protein [Peptostreptococcus canis]MBC2576872.1 QueT transporter family protein [Peptostreptococcus canis]MBP1998640.1 putative membrane protein [Peptostreptococcus canis]